MFVVNVYLLMTLMHSLGHCYLMQDDLQKAYSAYQQALYLLPNPKVRRSYNYCTFSQNLLD
jgi:hypothetical protein